MSFGRPMKTLKAELIVTSIILVSAMLFSLEPTREFFMESLIEQQYNELETFKKMSLFLNDKHLKLKDLPYIITTLENLKNKNSNFILRDDVDILLAKSYGKAGNNKKSREILLSTMKNSDDSLSKMDAMLLLSSVYEKENSIQKAIQVIEDNKYLNSGYKKNEINFTLARLYYQMRNFKMSGKYIANIDDLDEDSQLFYSKSVQFNWKDYSRNEKKTILNSLSKMGIYSTYVDSACNYIKEYNPPCDEVESLALDIVYNCNKPFVGELINQLKVENEYSNIYREMADMYTLSKSPIQSHSGIVRGIYYYRLLWPISRRAHYNYKKALEYYNNYLKGDVDNFYVKKNLQHTIRNLLAFKKYDEITNIVEKTYSVLNLDAKTGVLSDDIAFWNGYASYKLGDLEKALKSFEGSVSKIPDSYYAIQSRSFINSILEEKKITEEEYIRGLDESYKNSQDINSKILLQQDSLYLQKGGRA